MQKARQRVRPAAQSGEAAIAADTQTQIALNDWIYKPFTTFENVILKPQQMTRKISKIPNEL